MKDMKKMLAAVMAFAMVFVAGFAIIGASDDLDATETSIADSVTELTNGVIDTSTASQSYVVKNDITIGQTGASNTAVTLYVVTGKTVTVGASANLTITIYSANADGTKYTDSSSVVVTKLTAGQLAVKIGSYVATGSPISLSSVGTTAVAGTSIDGTGDVSIDSSNLKVGTITITNVNYGILVALNSGDDTYYPVGKTFDSTSSTTLGADDTVTVRNGTITVKAGESAENSVELSSVVSTNGIVVTGKSAPEIKGTYTAGTITMKAGAFKCTDGSNGLILSDNAKLNAYADGTVQTKDKKIGATPMGLDGNGVAQAAVYVYGDIASNTSLKMSTFALYFVKANVTSMTVTNSTSVGMVTISGDVVLTGGVISGLTGTLTLINGDFTTAITSIASTDTITVSEDAKLTLTGTTITLNGKMNVYGELAGSSQTLQVSCVAAGGTPGEFRSFDGAKIGTGVTIKLYNDTTSYPVKGIIDIAMGTKTVTGEVMGTETYYQSQAVVVYDYYDVKNNSTVYIYGSFEVPEGTTVTIYKGSTIEIDGDTSVVKIAGKVIVEQGAYFTVEKSKNVEVTGVIESEGALRFTAGLFEIKNGGSVDSQGSFTGSAATVGIDSELRLSGSVSTEDIGITNSGIIILEEVDFGANNVTVSNVSDGAVVKVISYIANSTKKLTVNDANLKYNGSVVSSTNNAVETTITISSGGATGYSGMTITSSVILVGVNNTPVKQLDVSGSIEIYNPNDATVTYASSSVTVKGPNTLVTDKITLGENVRFIAGAASGDVLYVSGTIVANEIGCLISANKTIDVTGEIIVKGTTAISTASNVNAAYYKVRGTDDVTFQHYTTLAKAIEAGATDIKTYGSISVLDDVDVPAGVIIDNNGTIVIGSATARDVTVVFANGATLKGTSSVNVLGTLEFENKKDNKITGITSDVSVIGDVASKYTNIYTALGTAVEGDVITITKQTAVEIDSDITVGAGVTLNVPAGKSVKINDNVTVTVDGTVISYSGFSANTGFAVKEDSNRSALVVNGKFLTGEASTGTFSIYTKYSTPGAYYVITGSTGTYTYIAPLTVAVADAQDAGTIYLYGESKFTSVSVEATQAKNVVINMANGSKVQGDIELSTYASVDNNGATYDGTIKSSVGEIKLTNTKNFLITSTIDSELNEYLNVFETPVKAAGTSANAFKIVSGVVTAPGTSANKFDADSAKLSIASDATLDITGEAEVTDMKVDGTLIVSNGATGGKLTVTGYLQVNGTFIVEETDASKALLAGTATVPTLFVGISKSAATTGATATVSAPAIAGLEKAYILAGSVVSEKVLDACKELGKSTAFTVDGAEYMTVYVSGDVLISSIAFPELEGAEITKWQYTDSTGKLQDAKDKKIGEIKSASALIDNNVYGIYIVVDSGITDVYVDGELMAAAGGIVNGSTVTMISAGTHQITYKLKAGYGGDIKVTFNGQTAADGKFTISKDMDFKDDNGDVIPYKVTISGAVVEDVPTPEPTPVEPTKDDSMGITEYLLIVLVILAAILVVVVAIRMMRS